MDLQRKDKSVKGTLTAPDVPTGTEQCAASELPINSIRRDEVPGIHSISYNSEADCITITHDAHNRKKALLWVLFWQQRTQHTGLLGMGQLVSVSAKCRGAELRSHEE